MPTRSYRSCSRECSHSQCRCLAVRTWMTSGTGRLALAILVRMIDCLLAGPVPGNLVRFRGGTRAAFRYTGKRRIHNLLVGFLNPSRSLSAWDSRPLTSFTVLSLICCMLLPPFGSALACFHLFWACFLAASALRSGGGIMACCWGGAGCRWTVALLVRGPAEGEWPFPVMLVGVEAQMGSKRQTERDQGRAGSLTSGMVEARQESLPQMFHQQGDVPRFVPRRRLSSA
ncbi:hypothetical protein NDU88_003014 [Pleurodeles waltl]|uniref:Uncharacterized protein n=1 Tax=Pleurodeles waltl TaxID=8319 RepID=A0AAV7LE05_PLEWA|nr:hypothetical protein NDU88_003014 [Pleurodeles waltl]